MTDDHENLNSPETEQSASIPGNSRIPLSTAITTDDWLMLEQQLGREPNGCQEIVRRTSDGRPAVIRVASIVDGIPFPTLYWLADNNLSDLIYNYESRGATNQIQELIDDSESLQRRMIRDNETHIQRRAEYFDAPIRDRLKRLGIEEEFNKKGIGGNANFLRVRCLHAFLAAHLVEANVVGNLVLKVYGEEDPLVKALRQVH